MGYILGKEATCSQISENTILPNYSYSPQEYWSGLPFPPWGDLLDPGVKPNRHISPRTIFTCTHSLLLSNPFCSWAKTVMRHTHTLCTLLTLSLHVGQTLILHFVINIFVNLLSFCRMYTEAEFTQSVCLIPSASGEYSNFWKYFKSS